MASARRASCKSFALTQLTLNSFQACDHPEVKPRSGSPTGKHLAAAVVLLPWVSPDPTTALPLEHSPALRLEGPTSGRSICRRGCVRRPAWNVVLVNRVLRCEPDHVALGGVALRSAVPHLHAANIDPESSLNPTGEKIVAEICTGKSVFMGFPAHIGATIGTACADAQSNFFSNRLPTKLPDLWRECRMHL